MKIVQVCLHDQGGAHKAAIRLHQALLNKGYDSNILFFKRNGSEIIPKSQVYSDSSFFSVVLERIEKYVRKVKMLNAPKEFDVFSNPSSYFNLLKHPLIQSADIINLHWVSRYVDIPSFFTKENKKKIVWTLHDINSFTGGCHYASGCEEFKVNQCVICPQIKGTLFKNTAHVNFLTKQRSYEQIKNLSIVALCSWMKQNLEESELLKSKPHYIIPNSLDIEIFKPKNNKEEIKKKYNIPVGKKVLLFVSNGYANKRKGFDLLIDSLQNVNSQELVVCTVGGRLTQQIPFDIIDLGVISSENEMANVIAMSDVFVLPSREDNLPNVMLESMSCGTPVISFPIGGMLDVIETGFNGILATDMSSKSLGEAIQRFLDEEFNFDVAKIRQFTCERYSQDVQAEKYVELYKKVINESS